MNLFLEILFKVLTITYTEHISLMTFQRPYYNTIYCMKDLLIYSSVSDVFCLKLDGKIYIGCFVSYALGHLCHVLS